MTENLQHHPANRNFAGEAPLADLLPHVFSLDGLRDRKGRRRINLVQDERLREPEARKACAKEHASLRDHNCWDENIVMELHDAIALSR